MFQSKQQDRKERNGFALVLVVSALVHLALIVALPDAEEKKANTFRNRVQARVVTPPPKPKPKKVAEVKKKEPPKKKEEPKKKEDPKKEVEKPKVEKKVAKKRKVKRKPKKRRPARSLTRKTKTPAPAAAPTAQPVVEKTGSVIELGELDFDATDEEVNREYDPDATDDEAPEPTPEPVVVKKDVPKDRKATCKVKARYPPGASAVLPATVVLTVQVRSNGTVASANVVSSVEDVLDNEAKKALLQAKCRPAIKNGVRVAARIPFRVEFK